MSWPVYDMAYLTQTQTYKIRGWVVLCKPVVSTFVSVAKLDDIINWTTMSVSFHYNNANGYHAPDK